MKLNKKDMKKPFDIKYRPQIESGEYKVETRGGKPARIVCWDFMRSTDVFDLLVCIPSDYEDEERETAYSVNAKGERFDGMQDSEDLFVVISEPEPELNDFEKTLMDIVNCRGPLNPMTDEGARNNGSILLKVARKELEAEFENELDKAYKNRDEVVFKEGVEKGKAEAMEDMPKWESDNLPTGCAAIDISALCGIDFIRRAGRIVRISSPEKLPGFNED